MNAPVLAIASDRPDRDSPAGWSARHSAVNLWRGRCLHLFARAEAGVSEALLMFATDPANAVTLPLMVGPRFDELERILVRRAASAGRPCSTLAAVKAFREHDRLRVFLCHGVATVLTDQRGDWHVMLDVLAFRNGAEVRDELFLTSGKAAAQLKALNADSHRLCQKLAALAPA